MTERLHFHFSLSCIGEGNGNPLQYSCLENPRDGGAWWAAVYGVTHSPTRLKQLCSSSSSKACKLQDQVTSHQATNREKIQPHPSANQWIKVLLSTTLTTRGRTSSTHGQALPLRSLHKPVRQTHPPEGRQQKQELYSCCLQNENHTHRKLIEMKMQRIMSQMKEQDKTPEKQLNEVKIGNLSEKVFRIMI